MLSAVLRNRMGRSVSRLGQFADEIVSNFIGVAALTRREKRGFSSGSGASVRLRAKSEQFTFSM